MGIAILDKINAEQAKAIVDMRLAQLTNIQQEKLHEEYEEIERRIAYFEQILSDDELCRKVIKDELIEVKEKYGDERRTEICLSATEFNPEDFYANDPVVITLSHLGYIKRTPLSEFHAQGRGGVGSKLSSTRDEDFIQNIYPATMHNTMLFFTKKGRCYWLKCYEIPEGDKHFKGLAPVDCYQEGEWYKYTYGASTDYNEISRLRKSILDRFPEAFIVAFKGGQKLNVGQAIREFKSNK